MVSKKLSAALAAAACAFAAQATAQSVGVAGGFSNIVTPARLPKEAINHVGKELGEHLNVSISQTAKK